jgi:ABC-type nickel/cobalt efflux system permease component RcnA
MTWKIIMLVLCSSLGVALALSSSNTGIVYAKANTVATIKLEVRNAKNVLFNRKGTTTFTLSNPFGQAIISGLP